MKTQQVQRPGHAPDPAICPLCDQPNQCQMAGATPVNGPCWCVRQEFPAELLDRVPEAARSRACICARCVAAANADVD